jgi:hypothetical protein
LKGKSMNERKVLEITGDLSGSPAWLSDPNFRPQFQIGFTRTIWTLLLRVIHLDLRSSSEVDESEYQRRIRNTFVITFMNRYRDDFWQFLPNFCELWKRSFWNGRFDGRWVNCIWSRKFRLLKSDFEVEIDFSLTI